MITLFGQQTKNPVADLHYQVLSVKVACSCNHGGKNSIGLEIGASTPMVPLTARTVVQPQIGL